MTNLLYCFKYKSYYNREERSENSIADFRAVDTHFYVQEDIENFNYGDGVTTTQVVDEDVEGKDYAVLTDEYDNIIARFYILECKYSRYQQYIVTLFRDLVYDFKTELSQATCFIEKGTVDKNSPLIFNKEQMTTNQIKSGEISLADPTGSPWIVMYVDKNKAYSGSVTPNPDYTTVPSAHTAWTHYGKVYKGPAYAMAMRFNVKRRGIPPTVSGVSSNFYGSFSLMGGSGTGLSGYVGNVDYVRAVEAPGVVQNLLAGKQTGITESLSNVIALDLQTPAFISLLKKYDNKKIQFTDGLYEVRIKIDEYESDSWITAAQYDPADQALRDALAGKGLTFSDEPIMQYKFKCYTYTVEMTSAASSSTSYAYSIPADRAHTTDAPYDILCMPYGRNGILTSSTINYTIPDVAMQVAADIAKAGAAQDNAGGVYDVQLLPYCPFNLTSKNIDTSLFDTKEFSFITASSGNIKNGIILVARNQSFVKTINLDWLEYDYLAKSQDAVEKKVKVQCDTVRFCSPNYNGVFEMGIQQNDGIDRVNIKCTYLPYSPYIHVAPEFRGLYGGEYNDQRGLVCGGSFALPIMTDQWQSYQAQNANYQAIFDREVQSIEVQNKYARVADWVGVGTGAIGAAGTGAALGSAGGVAGGIAGAAVAGVASLGAGIADVAINEKLRNESLDLKKDLFGYQLGNIQALPKSLSRTTAFNIDNKYFPFIEYYTATEIEKNAVRQKITWDGMSVGVVGKLDDYWQNFIKAEIIRCPSIGDYHVMNALSNELSKGVYR